MPISGSLREPICQFLMFKGLKCPIIKFELSVSAYICKYKKMLIKGESITLRPSKNIHPICLTNITVKDIISIQFRGDYEGIERIDLRVGDVLVGTTRDPAAPMPLPAGGLKMSKIWSVYVNLIIHYKDSYIAAKCEYGDEKVPYDTIVTVDETLTEFVDAETGEIRDGYVRTTKRVPTNRTVSVLVREIEVTTPDVEIEVRDSNPVNVEAASYWQEVRIDTDTIDPRYMERLVKIHSLTPSDEPGIWKVRNVLQYMGGLAGPLYTIVDGKHVTSA
jgi:hypothetical protein